MPAGTGIDPRTMREAVGRFPSGVTIVTARNSHGEPHGCTVSAFCSLSLDPPLVLICIGRGRRMHDTLITATGFVVNVLGAAQAGLARDFAGRAPDRCTAVPLTIGDQSLPRIPGAVAHLECREPDILPGGDHIIVVGQVVELDVSPGEPLMFVDGTLREAASPEPSLGGDWLTLPSW